MVIDRVYMYAMILLIVYHGSKGVIVV